MYKDYVFYNRTMSQLRKCCTGCPGSKFATSKSFYSKIMLGRPQDGKAKMCLRDIHFCLHLELFVYNTVKIMTKDPSFQSCLHGLEV